jgi:hypothetical protein
VRWPVGKEAVVVVWLSQWKQGGAEGQLAVAGGGGEEGFAFTQGDEQQVGGAGLVPEDAFAVDPGGFGAEHSIAAGFCEAVGGFGFGAAVVAVHAQRHRQGLGQRVEAALTALGEQLQQLDQLLAPGAGLPEHIQGLIEGSPLAAGAEQLGGEHQPLAHLALGEGLWIGRRGGGQGGGGGAQTVGVVEVEQAGGDGAAEALLLGMG